NINGPFAGGNRFIGLFKDPSAKKIALIGGHLYTDIQRERLQFQLPGFLGIKDYSFKDYRPKWFSFVGFVLYIVFGHRDILAPKIIVRGIVQCPKIRDIYGGTGV